MNILALDLGSTTGFAYTQGDKPPFIGSHTWATDKELRDMRANRLDRRGDIRVVRFFDWLTNLHEAWRFDTVVFEDVQFHTSTAQSQLWSSFRTTVWLAFPRTLIEAVPVGTLKKFATGSGSADKNQMSLSLRKAWPGFWNDTLDDNAVDAAWLWVWARHNLSRKYL